MKFSPSKKPRKKPQRPRRGDDSDEDWDEDERPQQQLEKKESPPDDGPVVTAVTPNGLCTFALRAVPLPHEVIEFLLTHAEAVVKLTEASRNGNNNIIIIKYL